MAKQMDLEHSTKEQTSRLGNFLLLSRLHVVCACDVQVHVFCASQIASVMLRHEVQDASPCPFEVTTESFEFRANITLNDKTVSTKIRGTQFPIISILELQGTNCKGHAASLFL